MTALRSLLCVSAVSLTFGAVAFALGVPLWRDGWVPDVADIVLAPPVIWMSLLPWMRKRGAR